MQTRAIVKNVGVSSKKARIPANIVKGMKVGDALSVLKYMPKGAALHIYKAVRSAASNAMQKEMSLDNLYVFDVRIDKGQFRVKHYHPRAKGGGYYGWLRGKSHITVVLSDTEEDKNRKPVKKEVVKSTKKETSKADKVVEESNPEVKKVVKKTTPKAKTTPKKVKNDAK
jgi:large subunit ribosomal protein L22